MYPPIRFLATYECGECYEQLELHNVYIPEIGLWCEECYANTKHYLVLVEHRSIEWDEIVDDM